MRHGRHMLETFTILFLHSYRNLKNNIRSSPVLYLLFTIMLLFSSLFIGFLTVILLRTDVSIDINNVFLIVLFLFIIKGAHDFYQHFTISEPLAYALSSPVKQRQTIFDVFLFVFWVNLGIWAVLSFLYTLSLLSADIYLGYPLLYLKFTSGVMLGSILGAMFILHFFSNKKYRLIPLGFFIYAASQFTDFIVLVLILIVSFLYLFWSLHYSIDSYQYIDRKERKKEKAQLWVSDSKWAVFYKEIIVLWRERILFSILFSAVIMGIATGYLARFGAEEFLPENLQSLARMISPRAYAFFGIYVLTIHGAVFPSLNFFLNEADTLWLLRHVPVKMKTIVQGKALAIGMPFLCSIPFIAYYAAFNSTESIVFLIWLLLFSFLASLIICFPLGARYVGKQSDILVLYSISLVIFIVLNIGFSLHFVLSSSDLNLWIFYLGTILFELFLFLVVSMRVTAKSLSVPNQKR